MRSSTRPEPLLDEAALTRAIDSHGLVMLVPAARRSSAKPAGPEISHEAEDIRLPLL